MSRLVAVICFFSMASCKCSSPFCLLFDSAKDVNLSWSSFLASSIFWISFNFYCSLSLVYYLRCMTSVFNVLSSVTIAMAFSSLTVADEADCSASAAISVAKVNSDLRLSFCKSRSSMTYWKYSRFSEAAEVLKAWSFRVRVLGRKPEDKLSS